MKIYSYGMTVWSTLHRLQDGYPEEDTYGEIVDTRTVPGGEAANAALLLDHWGHEIVLDGCHTGKLTRDPLQDFFAKTGVDISLMTHDSGFSGWRDIVLCAGKSRTVLGWFGRYFSGGKHHWTTPSREKVRWADCVILDPFFPNASEALATMCFEEKTDFVTVDCRWENPMSQGARAIILSREYLNQQYPGECTEKLIQSYAKVCAGLIVITHGSEPVLMLSPGESIIRIQSIEIDPVDTLAAGDSFRAGLVHGLLSGSSDTEATRLGTCTAAAVCQRFPSIHPLPSLDEIEQLSMSPAGS